MTGPVTPPFRRAFDASQNPRDARNALGITGTGGGGGGGAPVDAQYIVAVDDPTLTNDRVLTNTATVTWDFSTAGQAKANAAVGGNVSNSGTPTVGQYAKWVTATTIQGVAPATVLSDIGAQPAGSYQPLDADLTSLAAAAATNVIYYRSAVNTWSPVTIGANLTFSGGTLAGSVAPPIGFSAHKNGTAQTGVAHTTFTKITFGTEAFDQGSYYDPATSRWTPPAGMVHIDAGLLCTAGLVAGTQFWAAVYKNGVLLKDNITVLGSGGFGANGTQIGITDVCSGTDYYEIFTWHNAGAGVTLTIGGVAADTWFCGHVVK